LPAASRVSGQDRYVAPQFFGLEFEEFRVKVALSPLALSPLNFLPAKRL
jgi:hypothetical protein